MQKVILVLVALMAAVSAFMPSPRNMVRSQLYMANDFQKAVAASMIGASLFLGGSAKADIDYEGVKYLGGGEKIDLNNANVRAYLKVKGMYPNLAGKVVTNGPFKSVADVYNIPGLTGAEKDVLKANEGRFLALDVRPEYDIDKINNGLYR